MAPFRLNVDEHEGIPVIGIEGDLDLMTAPRVRLAADALMGTGHRYLIFDLEETSFIDSSGVAVLVAARRELTPEGGVRIVAGQGPARRLLMRLGLQAYLGIHANREEAAAFFLGQTDCRATAGSA